MIRPCWNASWIADRIAAERRCSPPANTPTARPSYSNVAGVTAVPSRPASARTQKIRRRSASSTTAALTSGSSVAAMTYHAPSRSPSSKGLSVNVIPLIASTAGVADLEMTCTSAPVAISSGMRRWATVPPPTTTTFLPASRRPTRYGVIGHPASLEVAAAATKRVTACGRPAGWVCR